MRLTHRDKYGRWCSDGSKASLRLGCPRENDPSILWGDAVNKLAAYEDAEEEGRLVILPCKVGDKFYRAIKETRGRPDRINEYVCIGFYYVNFDGQGLQIRAYETSDGIGHGLKIDVLISASRFGKDIFLTREEAEAALKGEKTK